MVRRIALKIRKKWPRNTARAVDNYQDMIKLVEVNPMAEASKQAEKWKDRLRIIMDAGVWEAIMEALPKEMWDYLVVKLGFPHFPEGVRTKAFKVEAFSDAWESVYLPELEKLDKEVPPITDADRQTRMIRNREILLTLKGKWRPVAKIVVPTS